LGAHQTTSSRSSAGDVMAADSPGRRHEVLGIVAAAAAVLFGLALASYDARSTENLAGPVGAGLAGTVVAAFGITAWLLPFELAAASVRLFRGRGAILGVATVVSTLVFTLVGCSLLHLALEGTEVHGGHLPGGLLGEVLGEVLRSLFGTAGAYVLTISVLLITLVLRTRLTITGMIARVRVHGGAALGKVRESFGAVAEADHPFGGVADMVGHLLARLGGEAGEDAGREGAGVRGEGGRTGHDRLFSRSR